MSSSVCTRLRLLVLLSAKRNLRIWSSSEWHSISASSDFKCFAHGAGFEPAMGLLRQINSLDRSANYGNPYLWFSYKEAINSFILFG